MFLVDDAMHARVLGAPTLIECGDDEAALEYARQLSDGRPVEVWDQSRFIGLVTRAGKVM